MLLLRWYRGGGVVGSGDGPREIRKDRGTCKWKLEGVMGYFNGRVGWWLRYKGQVAQPGGGEARKRADKGRDRGSDRDRDTNT
eukprot:394835-Hanusia_phi.AAC.4